MRLGRSATAALAVGLSVAGIVVVLLATRWGIGTSVDSVAYIRAARALTSGSEDVLLVQHAPLYSFLLAVGGVLGLDPMSGARWLNALTFGVNIFLVGALVRGSVRNCDWCWVSGSLLTLVLVPMLTAHVTALSEPLFVTFTLTGFWLLARYLENPTVGRLLPPAIVIGMTLLARYAGAACILTGLMAIFLLTSKPWQPRVRHAVLFGALASMPMVAWMLRNVLVGSTATGRELAFHPVGMPHAWQALYTASGWLLIPQTAPDIIRFAVWSVLGVLIAVVAVRGTRAPTPVPALVRVLALFVVTYGVFLAASISFVDANTPLDDRILLPVLAVSLVLAAYVFDTLWPLARRAPVLAYALVALVILVTGGHAVRAATVAATGYEQGWGFSSIAWRHSPTLGHLAHLDPHRPVFSNAPEIVYLHTGRPALGIPRTRFLMNQQANSAFATQVAALEREARDSCGVVVYLRNLAQQAMPGEAEIGRRLSLDVLWDEDDGMIWGVQACQR